MADAAAASPGRRPPPSAPFVLLAVAFAAVPILQLGWSTASGGFQSSFQTWTFYAVPWALGLAVAFGAAARERPFHQALGMGLLSVPVWDTLWGILSSFVPLVQGGFVLRPYSRYQLSGLYSYKFLADLGYLAAGFLLYASPSGRLGALVSQRPRRLAQRLREAGLPMGRPTPFSEGRSLAVGLALFPLLLAVTLVANLLLSGVQQLNQSDETSVFANMTPYHALLISLAAGFGEELAYRGVLMGWLSRRAPMAVAVLLQSVVFAFAHSGYGTWSHVLLPLLFGLVAGAVAWAFGIWASITLHVLVDVYAFGVESIRSFPWMERLLDATLFANLVFTLVAGAWALAWMVNAAEARRIAPR